MEYGYKGILLLGSRGDGIANPRPCGSELQIPNSGFFGMCEKKMLGVTGLAWRWGLQIPDHVVRNCKFRTAGNNCFLLLNVPFTINKKGSYMGHFKITSCLFLAVYVLGHVPFCPIYAPGGASLGQYLFFSFLADPPPLSSFAISFAVTFAKAMVPKRSYGY